MITASRVRSSAGRLPRNCGTIASVALAMFFAALPSKAQVLTVDTNNGNTTGTSATVDRQYAQIQPTHVELPSAPLDEKTRMGLLRLLQSEQGFAMRPLPRGHKGLTLHANGNLSPAGESYLNEVVNNGISAKPGERVVISDVKIDHDKITFLLNGGPDKKHRFLSHIQIGIGMGGGTSPVVADDGTEATGARITLAFDKHTPALSGSQVKALLAPLISFDVKTPIQAFTDTLPTSLRQAIFNHEALVGMSIDMLVFSKGQPVNKTREMDGQMPFEEWTYGTPPADVEFVRINGNRVIRVELAQIGKPPVIFTDDVVSGMLRSDGKPVNTVADATRISRVGDVQRDPDKQSAAAPPTLGKPNAPDPLDPDPIGTGQNHPVMRPVQRPLPHTDDSVTLGANPDDQPAAPSQPSSADAAPGYPATGPTPQPPDADQTPPAGAHLLD